MISPVNCHTISLSQYIDHHLQPHVKELKFYVKKSTDFIKKINNLGKIPENSILVNTNIPHIEGMKAAEATLKRKNKPTKVIITFLKLILKFNSFVINCKNYYKSKDVL